LSDNVKNEIYNNFATKKVGLHELSTQYGIAVKRLEAIIRLKALEVQWKKDKKPLQTGFLVGMEAMLGVRPGGRLMPIQDEINSIEREEVRQADNVAKGLEDEGGHKGLALTYFEPVDEGEDAVLPRLLDERRKRLGEKEQAAQHHYPSHVVETGPGRPAYRFIDVGLRWFDKKEGERREKASAHRKAVKERKKTVIPPSKGSQSESATL